MQVVNVYLLMAWAFAVIQETVAQWIVKKSPSAISHSRDVGTGHTGQEDSIAEEKYAIIHNLVRSTGVDFENTFSHPTVYLARKTNI